MLLCASNIAVCVKAKTTFFIQCNKLFSLSSIYKSQFLLLQNALGRIRSVVSLLSELLVNDDVF